MSCRCFRFQPNLEKCRSFFFFICVLWYWENVVTLSSLPFQPVFLHPPTHIFNAGTQRTRSCCSVTPGWCWVSHVGGRDIPGSHLYLRTASTNSICMKVTRKYTKHIWLSLSVSPTPPLSWIQKCMWPFKSHLTRKKWCTLCQNNSNRRPD